MTVAEQMLRGRESLAPVGAVGEEQLGPRLWRFVVTAHVHTVMGWAARLAPVCVWDEDVPFDDYE